MKWIALGNKLLGTPGNYKLACQQELIDTVSNRSLHGQCSRRFHPGAAFVYPIAFQGTKDDSGKTLH